MGRHFHLVVPFERNHSELSLLTTTGNRNFLNESAAVCRAASGSVCTGSDTEAVAAE